MILCAQLMEGATSEAIKAFRKEPRPRKIEGMRFARSYLTAELRRGMLPSLVFGGCALITAWDDDDAFDRFLDHPASRPYQHGWHVRTRPARSVGLLPGLPEWPRREVGSHDLPVTGLTVGRVRAAKLLPFVKAAGAAEREAASHPGFIDGLTLFRPPLVIGTFSIWRSAAEVRRYALGTYPGGHARAMAKSQEQRFNTDMFFSRQIPYASAGQWRGRDPLAGLVLAESSAGEPLVPLSEERVVLNGRSSDGKTRSVPSVVGAPDA